MFRSLGRGIVYNAASFGMPSPLVGDRGRLAKARRSFCCPSGAHEVRHGRGGLWRAAPLPPRFARHLPPQGGKAGGIFAATVVLFILVVPGSASADAALPKLSAGMNAIQVRGKVRIAGWRIPAKSWCKPTFDNYELEPKPGECAIPFTKQLIRKLPEVDAAAMDRPYVNTCYNDGAGHSLIVTFTYDERQKNALEDIEDYRMADWRIEDKVCEHQ
jgi:hypothetical protein